MNDPLVSIVVCTHNRSAMLKYTMETVFKQQYKPVEVLVVDDGSTDNTKELIESYGDGVKYFRHDNQGIAATRSIGCQLAKGEYIAFQDDDDLMPPERINYLYEALCQYPDAVLAVGDWEVIDSEGNLSGRRSKVNFKVNGEEPVLLEDGLRAVLWPLITPLPHTTLFRKSDGERIGWFDNERFHHACSDTDFFARLGKMGPVIYIPKIVSYYRMGHDQIWSKKLLSEYSRILLFEKHLSSLGTDQEALKKRIEARVLNYIKRIKYLLDSGVSTPDSKMNDDYVRRGLSLLGMKNRLSYKWYSTIRLPLRNLIKGHE